MPPLGGLSQEACVTSLLSQPLHEHPLAPLTRLRVVFGPARGILVLLPRPRATVPRRVFLWAEFGHRRRGGLRRPWKSISPPIQNP